MAERVFDETPQRVVDKLEEWMKNYGFDFDSSRVSYGTVADAYSLAKYRVPEEPKKIRPGRYVKSVGQCPSCGRLVDTSGDFCKRCGKALKWKEAER